VDRVRHQGLAGARFAADHHGQIAVHDLRHNLVEPLHRRAAPHQRQFVGPLFNCGTFRHPLARLQRARRALHQVGQVERFGKIVESLRLGGLDRGHDRVLCRDHDHRQAGAVLGDLGKHLQPVAVGHNDVRDHHIAAPLAHPAHQRCQARGGMHPAPRPRQRLCQNRPDRAVVVGDQYRAVHVLASLACRRRLCALQ